jgi:molybdate transport system substrate-binding protein
VAILAGALAACAASPVPAPDSIELTVYAAASLRDAIETSASAYRIDVPAATLTVSTDSSAALRAQIEQGAPADVFLSADTTNAQRLVDSGLTDGPAVPFAANTLVVIVPTDNPAGIETPAGLARPGLKIVAAGDQVPITTYALEAIGNLAALPGYPADFAACYDANVVSREDNVRAVVAKIELGEGDAGIVYATDAKASSKVATIAIPAEANVVASYAGVVLKASSRAPAAHAFLDWLAGSRGRATLAEFGFLPPP